MTKKEMIQRDKDTIIEILKNNDYRGKDTLKLFGEAVGQYCWDIWDIDSINCEAEFLQPLCNAMYKGYIDFIKKWASGTICDEVTI